MENAILVDKRNHALEFEASEVVAKLLLVATVNLCRTRSQVGKSPDGKHGTSSRPSEDGKTHPFKQFAEIVG